MRTLTLRKTQCHSCTGLWAKPQGKGGLQGLVRRVRKINLLAVKDRVVRGGDIEAWAWVTRERMEWV